MIYLFSNEGKKSLAAFLQTKPLLAFDYDGTLSAIVADPADAFITPEIRTFLEQLSEKYKIALISGRSLESLRNISRFEAEYMAGNHGAEIKGFPSAPATNLCAGWKSEIEKAIWQSLYGIIIEDKGLSLSVHYRNTKDPEKAESIISEVIERLKPEPQVITGKKVFNLLPEGSPNKGSALLAIMEKAKVETALFVGDDITDEAVFALNTTEIFTVSVGKREGCKALYYIHNQREVSLLLEALVCGANPGLL